MRKRIKYFFGLVILVLGVWMSVSMYMGLLNPGTFFAVTIVVVLIAIPVSPVIRRASYKIWVSIGLITLVVLFIPTFDFMKILIISFSLIITALLINSNLQVSKKRRGSIVGKSDGLQEQPKNPAIMSIIIPALSMLLPAKAFHSFYWFMVWDSTTDSLDWLWLPIPVLALIFSSLLLYFLLPGRTKPAGFLYLMMIPAMIGVFNLAEQIDFRQLTNQRAEHVSRLIENYQTKVGYYPENLQELTPWYLFSLKGPVIIYGENWCYDSGEDYYRLGYINREHWSSPNLIGQIHKSKGQFTSLNRMCEKEANALMAQDPHGYWTFEESDMLVGKKE